MKMQKNAVKKVHTGQTNDKIALLLQNFIALFFKIT